MNTYEEKKKSLDIMISIHRKWILKSIDMINSRLEDNDISEEECYAEIANIANTILAHNSTSAGGLALAKKMLEELEKEIKQET